MLVTSLMIPTKHETKQLKEEEDFVGLQSGWGTQDSIMGRSRRRVSHISFTLRKQRKNRKWIQATKSQGLPTGKYFL